MGPLAAAMESGFVGGFVGGMAGTLLYGGSIGSALKNGFVGGLFGAVSAGIANKIGTLAKHAWVAKCRHLMHGVSQGMINTVRGESFVGGFLAGFAGSYVTHAGFSKDCGRFEYAMSGAVVGGTAEAIGGGKFENGAVTGAFVGLFNAGHEPH